MAYPNTKKIPWFMFPYYSNTEDLTGLTMNAVITTDTVPQEVNDSKKLNYYEQSIPGGYTSIYKYGSAGARKVSFKLEIADFNDDVGLGLKLAQFDLLRRPEINIVDAQEPSKDPLFGNSEYFGKPLSTTGQTIANAFSATRYRPFFSNPYVIYYNSIFNAIPLPFRVLKCDWVTSKPNRLGRPQYAIIDFELAQMEEHELSAAEDKAKWALAAIGAFGQSIPNLIKNIKAGNSKQNVYKNKTSKLGF